MLYTVSKSPETSSFQPYDKSPLSLAKENIHLGFQPTVSQSMPVFTVTFVSCWATIAHTPKPAYTMAMPTTALKRVPPRVAKKKRLNCSVFDT